MVDNVRVAVRVRPLITRELKKGVTTLWTVDECKTISQINCPAISFCFDRVFDGLDDNQILYEEICSPIVKNVMHGFNGTIFAYGQTSSGKTFTMIGEDTQNTLGVLHHTVSEIFHLVQNMPEREFLIRVSCMEIYNEKVSDLLSKGNDNLKIQEDKYGFIRVIGLNEHIVQKPKHVLKLMKDGEKKRHIGETLLNQKSSRSHLIFRMIIESRMRWVEDVAVHVSQLNLVDLAGSERVEQAGTTGERFKESVHINKSLFMLSQVINQLSENDNQYVNYRDSKLTRLLQNSLGGNALTAIICTVTPACLEETLSTLKFASRAKNIKNKPQVNEILTDQALIKQYENELKLLNKKLEASKMQNKELEEEKKQNEALKQQIEQLKAKFISQLAQGQVDNPVILRRETWAGQGDFRRLRITSCDSGYSGQNFTELHHLEEEPGYEDCTGILDKTSFFKRRGASQSISWDKSCNFLHKFEETTMQIDSSKNTEDIFSTNCLTTKSIGVQINCFGKNEDAAVQTTYEMNKTVAAQTVCNINKNIASQTDCKINENVTVQTDSYESKDVAINTDFFESTEYWKTQAESNATALEANFVQRTSSIVLKAESLRAAENSVSSSSLHTVCDKENAVKNIDSSESSDTKCHCEFYEKYQLLLQDMEEMKKHLAELEKTEQKEETVDEINLLKNKVHKKSQKVEKYSEKCVELETRYNSEKAEWNAKTIDLIKDLEDKYEQELADQEAKFEEILNAKIHELKEIYSKKDAEKTKEFRNKIQELELVQDENVSNVKECYEKKLKELDSQLLNEITEKQMIKCKVENNCKQENMILKLKHEDVINKYKSKLEKIKNAYIHNENELKFKTDELEELRKKVMDTEFSSKSDDVNMQHLKQKINDITIEKDSISNKYCVLKKQFAELKAFQQKEVESDKQNQTKLKELKYKVKSTEETVKNLLYELDRKKAKIITLEINNANFIKEIKKLKEHFSKCAKAENNVEPNEKKIELNREKSIETKAESLSRENNVPKEVENLKVANAESSEQEKALLSGGGIGAAKMVKIYWLERELKKKDKEIARLKKQKIELKTSSLKKEDKVISNQPDDAKLHIVDFYDFNNENTTVCCKELHPYPPGVIPKVKPKRILKEKNEKAVSKSVAHEQGKELLQKKTNIDSGNGPKQDVLKTLSSEADYECKQQ